MDLYVTTVGDTRHYLYVNYGGYFQEEALERNCSMQTNDKRKLSGMTPNVGDFNLDGFPDIYVTEWLPHTLGKVMTAKARAASHFSVEKEKELRINKELVLGWRIDLFFPNSLCVAFLLSSCFLHAVWNSCSNLILPHPEI